MKITIITLCLSLIAATGLAKTVNEFDLKITIDDTHSFSQFPKNHPKHSFYGSYSPPFSETGGMTIDIFPNGNFTIMEWCDVCRDKLLAKGIYTFENCIITFQYTDIVQKNYKSSFPNEW